MSRGPMRHSGLNGSFTSVSLDWLGDAIHTAEDYTSPMHTSPSGEPLVWRGALHGGFQHWQGENSPSDNWADFGKAIRLTMAAFMQANPELAKKHGLTDATFDAEADRRISQYVENFFLMSGNVMGTDRNKEGAARQCALGNPAACEQWEDHGEPAPTTPVCSRRGHDLPRLERRFVGHRFFHSPSAR